jgi:GTP-binding protein EngB required for normal cell division
VGFAKVPKAVRAKWAGFMREYLYERATLKVVFHLVDSRTGPVAADEELMRVMAGLLLSL